MKNILAASIWMILANSCLNNKHIPLKSNEDKTIVYLMPKEVDVLLAKEIHKTDGKVFFELQSDGVDTLTIYLYHKSLEVNYPWVESTERKLFIDNNFYPLIFDFDRFFAIAESGTEMMQKLLHDKDAGMRTPKIIIEHSFFVKFKRGITNTVIKYGFE